MGIRFGLTWKIFLIFASVVVVMVAAFSLLANQAAEREIRGFMFQGGLDEGSRMVNELAAYYAGKGSWRDVGERFFSASLPGRRRSMGAGEHGMGMGPLMMAEVTLLDEDGEVQFSNIPSSRAGDHFTIPDSAAPIEVSGAVVGYLLVDDPFAADQQSLILERTKRAIWLSAGIAGLVALILGSGLAYGLLRPIRAMTLAARNLSEGDLSQRVRVYSQDELGELTDAFNRMAENLEAAEKLRQDMTADIAHELRNPLAVIQARLEALLDGVYPLNAESLEPLMEQSRDLNRLVEDLRTLALADAGKLLLEKEVVELSSYLTRTAEHFRHQLQEAGLTMELSVQPSGELMVDIDPIRIRQVIGNLIQNSIRHTPPGGWVKIFTGSPHEDGLVEISIEDSGEGIPAEDRPHIFERFYRVDDGRSRREGGTGLGLAIARQIVLQHGGWIRAESAPRGGARITFSLPGSSMQQR